MLVICILSYYLNYEAMTLDLYVAAEQIEKKVCLKDVCVCLQCTYLSRYIKPRHIFIVINAHILKNTHSSDLKIKTTIMVHSIDIKKLL